MKVLVTGGCGFIGHHMVDHILANTDWNVDIVDRLSYASFGFERLKATRANNNPRVRVFTNDIIQPINGYLLKELQDCNYIDKPLDYELTDFHSSRPGHDLRYSLNGDKLKNMGFICPKSFEDSMQKTIQWTVNNPKWLEE